MVFFFMFQCLHRYKQIEFGVLMVCMNEGLKENRSNHDANTFRF
jgi:hypothetical protein